MDQVEKVCVQCGRDVRSERRIKDQQGRYFCYPCWDQLAVMQRPAPVQPRLAAPLPVQNPVGATPPSAEPVVIDHDARRRRGLFRERPLMAVAAILCVLLAIAMAISGVREMGARHEALGFHAIVVVLNIALAVVLIVNWRYAVQVGMGLSLGVFVYDLIAFGGDDTRGQVIVLILLTIQRLRNMKPTGVDQKLADIRFDTPVNIRDIRYMAVAVVALAIQLCWPLLLPNNLFVWGMIIAILIVLSSAGVAVDAAISHTPVNRQKPYHGASNGWVMWFTACAFLWIVFVPLYLLQRFGTPAAQESTPVGHQEI